MRSIDDLIGSSPALRGLGAALAARDALLQRVRRALPDEIAPHCTGAALEGQVLRLLADSAAWATRLRYLGRELARALRADGIALSVVEVRVLPPDARRERTRRRGARPSGDAARCVEQTAEGVDDPALRAALLRLGGRLRR
jgi:hypothetical protein